jgi:hypothetical protein
MVERYAVSRSTIRFGYNKPDILFGMTAAFYRCHGPMGFPDEEEDANSPSEDLDCRRCS